MTAVAPLTNYSLCCFRTKLCNNFVNGSCSFKASTCIYSHNNICIRRCPYYLSDMSYIRYLPIICKRVVLGPDFRVLQCDCEHGNECIYSHCLDELLYHPQFYKIIKCKSYQEGKCCYSFCPFVHEEAEQRTIKHFYLPFTKGMDLPPIEYITPVDKIGKIRPNTKSLVKRKEKPIKAANSNSKSAGDVSGMLYNLRINNIIPLEQVAPEEETPQDTISRSSTIEREFVQLVSSIEDVTKETKMSLLENIKKLLESPRLF
ncbi:bifunctional Zinc finger [Babesia duncani]|uniref:Bifunctional Zinc finger n=1 Tax=Babesia duncani TaxID=323732 RepID=A0AAD9UMX0_9APIC|nr:bifunctional Zinc finger [Babesia duncani]